MTQFLHQLTVPGSGGLTIGGGELLEPFPEGVIEGAVLRAGDRAGLFDEVFVGAEGDVLHENSVHDSRVIAFVDSLELPSL